MNTMNNKSNMEILRFEESGHINNVAGWICHSLPDTKLAKQLAALDPTLEEADIVFIYAPQPVALLSN